MLDERVFCKRVKPCSREDVSVVALSRFIGLSKAFEGGEGRSGGEQSSALRVDVGLPQSGDNQGKRPLQSSAYQHHLLGGALCFAGRVGQSKDNRVLVEARHVLDDLRGEHVGDGRRADQNCRFQLPDNVGEILHPLVGVGKGHLVR